MALNWQRPGINHVGEFQSSGHVLAVAGSGSPVLLNYVAKSITFTNAAVGVKVITLYDNGSNAASFNLAGATTQKIDGKFLTFKMEDSNVTAFVELTNIPSASYSPPLFSDLKQ